MQITAAQLRALAPGAAPIVNGIVEHQALLAEADITTPRRIRHFLVQIAHESAGFTRLEEGLSYSAERLCQVWPRRFPTLASAQPYARAPAKLAEKVYGERLGNTAPGDGWAYRGSGLMQTTGKANFAEVERETGLPVVGKPELLRAFPGALQAACLFWRARAINAAADRDDVAAVTRLVNGGAIGLPERKALLAKALRIWPDETAPAAERPTLRLGAKGADVRALQALLTLTADGDFGPATERAVKAAQKRAGLASDGVVGPRTWAALTAA